MAPERPIALATSGFARSMSGLASLRFGTRTLRDSRPSQVGRHRASFAGQFGIAYDETDPAEADRETIIRNFLTGQYSDALRVVAFNTAEGWSRDVSEDVASEVLDRAFDADDNLSEDTKRRTAGPARVLDRLHRRVAAHRFIDRHVTPGAKRPPAPSLRRGTEHALRVGGRKTGA